MDVVYVVKPEDKNEELRYSLRSLVNIPHDNVWIAGYKPSWVKNVGYLERNQSSGSKYQNSTANLLLACTNNQISDDFIYMNDDFFIMAYADVIPTMHRGPAQEVANDYRTRYPTSPYVKGMQETIKLLKGIGIKDPLSYELHIPMIFNKQKLMEAIEVGKDLPVLHKRTLYGNLHHVGGKRMMDVKIYSSFRKVSRTSPFLSTVDSTFRYGAVGRYIRQIFAKPCRYENYPAVPIVIGEGINHGGLIMKIQDYKDGEIHKTDNGNYMYVKGGEKSAQYPSVAALMNAVDTDEKNLNEAQALPLATQQADGEDQNTDENGDSSTTSDNAKPEEPSLEWSKKDLESHYASLRPDDNHVFKTKQEVLDAISEAKSQQPDEE